MSPRSREYMAEARERLRACRVLLAEEIWNPAVSDAYYAVLYAARAALSEEDVHAKTHGGTWGLFHRSFVATGRFDGDLYAAARAAQDAREGVDYGAASVERQEAERIAAVAERFVNAVERMLTS